MKRKLTTICVTLGLLGGLQALRAQTSLLSDLAGNLQQVSPASPASKVLVTPWRQVVPPGRAAIFSAAWQKLPADTIVWNKNGIPIAGQTSEVLTFPNVTAGDEADYTATVTTNAGSVTSSAAKLYFDTDNDGLPDTLETSWFGGLANTGSMDSDGDGVTNAEEFEDGTNPNSFASVAYRLTVETIHGSVVYAPSSSTGRYLSGTRVTLRTVAEPGWEFAGWTGAATSASASLTVVMNGHKSLKATFVSNASIQNGTGAPTLTWTTGGGAPWQGQDANGVPEGGNVASSGAITNSQESWIETTVTGPGTLTWWWTVSSEAGSSYKTGDVLRVEVNGSIAHAISGEPGWQPVAYTLGAGTNTVRWVYQKDATTAAGQDAASLDAVVFTPGNPPSLVAGSELSSGLQLLASGDALWFSQTVVSNDGVDALQSPVLYDSDSKINDTQEAWVETTILNMGYLSFRWKVSSDSGDYLELWIDGTRTHYRYGEQDWELIERYMDGRPHKVRWRYVKNQVDAAGSDAAWLDQITFTAPPSLPAAVENVVQIFSTGGSAAWSALVSQIGTHDGVDCAQTGMVGNNQQTWMETTVTGPATVSFWWRVSSSSSDYLKLMLDGVVQTEISGTSAWAQMWLTVPSGNHQVRWSYEKDASSYSGEDRGWVDEVTVVGGVPLAEALDKPDVPWLTNGAGIWTSQTGTTHDGTDAAQAPETLASLEKSELGTVVVGPGTLNYWVKMDCAVTGSTSDGLVFQMEGRQLDSWDGQTGWIQVTRFLPPGEHALRWQFTRPTSTVAGSRNTAWIDQWTWTPSPAVALSAAADDASLVWVTGGSGTWTGATTPTASDGVDLAVAPVLDHNESAWMETSVQGPGDLTFRWKVSSESSDELRYIVDGEEVSAISGNEAWRAFTSSFAPGPHTVRWMYVKNSSAVANEDTACLDNVVFTPTASPALGTAVDSLSLTLHSSGYNDTWARQTANAHDGLDAAKSATTPDSANTWMGSYVNGPGTLTFWWSVSSQASGDYLRFYQRPAASTSLTQIGTGISGTTGTWQQVTYSVPAGRYFYSWIYSKNSNAFSGSDAGWVDEVAFTPSAPAGLAAAVELPPETAITITGPLWTSQSAVTHDGVDAAQSPVPGSTTDSSFEMPVSGPGVLSFWYRVSSLANSHYLRASLAVGGGSYVEFLKSASGNNGVSGEVGWTKAEIVLPPGQHRVKWLYDKNTTTPAGLDRAWVDEVKVSPFVGVAAGLDTALVFATGGDAPWSGVTTQIAGETHDGVDRSSPEVIGDNQQSWMETSMTGPGTLGFWWRASSEANGDFLRLIIDGQEATSISGDTGWLQVARTLGSGTHTVRWVYEKDTGSTSDNDTVYVDEVSFLQGGSPALADAIEQGPSASLLSSGNKSWIREVSDTHDGIDAAQSGVVGASQDSWLEMPVTGPCTLTLWCKTAGDGGDYLRFYVNGAQTTAAALSGNQPWQMRSFIINPGTNLFRCSFETGSSVLGTESAWVDQVSILPQTTLAEAVDSTGLSWSTGGDAVWIGLPTGTGSEDQAVSGMIPDSGRSWMETSFTGPGTINFSFYVSSASDDKLRLLVDGVETHSFSGTSNPWATQSVSIAPGLHTFRWLYEKDSSGTSGDDGARLDQVSFTPEASPSLPDALDTPALFITSGGARPWTRQGATTHDGVDALRSGAIGANQQTWASAFVEGPGALSFWWQTVLGSSDRLYLHVDGQLIKTKSLTEGWKLETLILPPGHHEVRWTYDTSSTVPPAGNGGWVDQVTFAPLGSPALNVAADSSLQTWSGGPTGMPGTGVLAAAAHDGTDMIVLAPPNESNATAWTEAVVIGPGTLSFWWLANAGRDARFFVDGVESHVLGGASDPAWKQARATVPAGAHTVRWECKTTSSNAAYLTSCAWIDEVSFATSVSETFAGGFQDAPVIIGQANATDQVSEASQSVTPGPSGCAISATGKMAVCDQYAGRVLIWNSIPISSGVPADVVVGKVNFTTTTSGRTAAVTGSCNGVAFTPDGQKLLVSDHSNHRVLIWNTVPTSNGVAADVVIGQTDFVTGTSGLSASKLENPTGLLVTPTGRLVVADTGNDRVLVFNSVPTSNGTAADVVIGQTSMTVQTAGNGASQMNDPWGVALAADGRLLVADQNNNRVLVFGSVPTTNGAAALLVIGQSAFGNGSSGLSASRMNSPVGIGISSTGLMAVSEFGNNRVLIFNSVPTVSGAAADSVLGQPDFASAAAFNGGVSAQTMDSAYPPCFSPDGRLLVPGRDMKRVMVFGLPAAGSPANITSLIPSTGTLSPAFSPSTISYSLVVANNESFITLTPTTAESGATVKISGVPVNSGFPSKAINLDVGLNPVSILVTAADSATTKSYSVTVMRLGPGSGNADLASLSLSSGSLNPVFASGTTVYTASVPNTTNSILITPTKADVGASVTINGMAVSSGAASNAISLHVGTNVINIVVTAENGAAKAYDLTITRDASANAALASLVLSEGSLVPAFSSATTTYSASVPNSTASITVTPMLADQTATVQVNNVAVVSGAPSGQISLAPGANTITTQVTAQDGTTTRLYSLVITRDFVAPEIVVEQPAGTSIADSGIKDFGLVSVGSNTSLIFTIKNTGTANLTGLTITKDGANASDFTVTTSPAAPVSGPSGSTTFVVRFAPSTAGARSATIHIASNDDDETLFDINLTGTGVAAPSPVKAQITSPTNGTTLTSTSLPLVWNAGVGVTRYDLYVGTTVGGKEIYSGNQGTALNRTVAVPANGGRIYVTLWSLIGGAWQSNTYLYTAPAPVRASLTSPSPANGSSLADGNLNLAWNAGLSVSAYSVYVGSTVGSRDIATRNVSAATTTQSIPVPQDGGPIYVTLWSQINGAWQSESYWFLTALPVSGNVAARLTSPPNTSTLGATTATFDWDAGTGVTRRDLWVGSSPDGYDLYKGANEAAFTRTLNNLPGDGRRIYATLHSLISGVWQSNAYYFTAVTSPSPQAAQLLSPANGSTLTNASLPLTWSSVAGATRYDLYVGSTPMVYDLYKGTEGLNTARTVTVPTDGRPIYLTLWSQISGKWLQNTYWFTAANTAGGNQKARMTSPANGSVLPGSTATFDWDTGTGVSNYSLYVGTTPGGRELYSATSSTIRSRTLTTLPTDGRKIYVTLWSQIGAAWQSNSYLYTAANIAGVKAEMLTPAPGSTFTSATVTFTWNAGTGTQYWLQVGRTPGSYDLYAGNQGTSLTRTITTMPTDGSPIYVKLQSLINGVWQTNEYIYQAALPP